MAAAHVCPGAEIASLRGDFNRINDILGSLVNTVPRDLAHIWPAFGWFGREVGTVDESVANFSMKVARREAWKVAETLAPLEGAALAAAILNRDGEAAAFGRFVWTPGWAAELALAVVRVSDRGGVRFRIDQLAR